MPPEARKFLDKQATFDECMQGTQNLFDRVLNKKNIRLEDGDVYDAIDSLSILVQKMVTECKTEEDSKRLMEGIRELEVSDQDQACNGCKNNPICQSDYEEIFRDVGTRILTILAPLGIDLNELLEDDEAETEQIFVIDGKILGGASAPEGFPPELLEMLGYAGRRVDESIGEFVDPPGTIRKPRTVLNLTQASVKNARWGEVIATGTILYALDNEGAPKKTKGELVLQTDGGIAFKNDKLFQGIGLGTRVRVKKGFRDLKVEAIAY